jgi:hypothetical protein
MANTANELIAKARSYLGEGPGYFYNKTGLAYGEAWCAAFIVTICKETGVDIINSMSCNEQCRWWRDKGRYTTTMSGVKPGDIVYFDWDHEADPEYSTRPLDHVGLVVGVSGNTVYTIEGNSGPDDVTSAQRHVEERTRTISSGSIMGYARPAYEGTSPDYIAGSEDGTGDTIDINVEPIDLTEYVESLKSEINAMMESSTRTMKYMTYTSKFFGAPFTFLEHTDPPIPVEEGDEPQTMGRTFTKNIALESPLVHFIPGVPSYLSNLSKSNMEVFETYVGEKMKNDSDDISKNALNSIMKEFNEDGGRYFNFAPSFYEYQRYFNMLARACSIYLGIGDKYVPGTSTKYDLDGNPLDGIKYKNYNYGNWQDGKITAGTSLFDENVEEDEKMFSTFSDIVGNIKDLLTNVSKDIFGGSKSVMYYVDAGSSFSESVSNSTGQSQIASLFDTGEGMVKELQFWTDGAELSKILGGAGTAITDAVGSLADGLLKLIGMEGSQLGNIGQYAKYLVSGSNIIFPEMWTDSGYDKSYRFTVNLVSPYGDIESIFINEIVPLMSILAMSLPRQTSSNSFTSPLLVRVVSKGWFSCDMGIITDVSIEKGGNDGWGAFGLPLSMKVDISVKDLYSSLSMSNTSQPGLFFGNDSLIEFLAATCGVETIQPNIALKIDTFINAYTHAVTDIPASAYEKAVNKINNFIMNHSGLFR